MEFKRIVFSGHAVRRMFHRGLKQGDVLGVIRTGEVIARYPDDSPYPSCLILGFILSTPVHVVLGMDGETRTGIVITAYEPDPAVWGQDFRTRREP